jgi:hypothetical protein
MPVILIRSYPELSLYGRLALPGTRQVIESHRGSRAERTGILVGRAGCCAPSTARSSEQQRSSPPPSGLRRRVDRGERRAHYPGFRTDQNQYGNALDWPPWWAGRTAVRCQVVPPTCRS